MKPYVSLYHVQDIILFRLIVHFMNCKAPRSFGEQGKGKFILGNKGKTMRGQVNRGNIREQGT